MPGESGGGFETGVFDESGETAAGGMRGTVVSGEGVSPLGLVAIGAALPGAGPEEGFAWVGTGTGVVGIIVPLDWEGVAVGKVWGVAVG